MDIIHRIGNTIGNTIADIFERHGLWADRDLLDSPVPGIECKIDEVYYYTGRDRPYTYVKVGYIFEPDEYDETKLYLFGPRLLFDTDNLSSYPAVVSAELVEALEADVTETKEALSKLAESGLIAAHPFYEFMETMKRAQVAVKEIEAYLPIVADKIDEYKWLVHE